VLVLVSRLYMYCNIVKLGVYVYHTRDMWMGPRSQVWNWIFLFSFWLLFYGTYCFPPSFLCNIFTLKMQTIYIFFVANDGSTDLCSVNIINCHDAEVCLGKINKSAGTDRKMNKYGRLCDALLRRITQFLSQSDPQGWTLDTFKQNGEKLTPNKVPK